jgi:Cu2+-exporting ATPase
MSDPHANCFHCGLPVTEPGRWTVVVDDIQQSMCCPACKTVCEAILAGGFSDYYRLRTEVSPTAENTVTDFSEYNLPAFQQSFTTRENDGTCTSLLFSTNIHCSACCWLIESLLNELPGVVSANVNLATRMISIQWRNETIQLSSIIEQLYVFGYLCNPYTRNHVLEDNTLQNRQQLKRIGVAGLCMMQVGMISIALYAGEFHGIGNSYGEFLRRASLLLTLPVIFYSAIPFFRSGLQSLKQKSPNMDVPISLAIIGAFLASIQSLVAGTTHLYFDSVCMFVFLISLTRYLEGLSRQKISEMEHQNILPELCHYLAAPEQTGHVRDIPLEEIHQGDYLLVKQGEVIPADGRIISGSTTVNEVTFSGESAPLARSTGDEVFAGTINGDGSIVIQADCANNETRLSVVHQLIQKGCTEKPGYITRVNRLARVFTSTVLGTSVLTAVVWIILGKPDTAIQTCLAVLVISCPCALSIATPATQFFAHHALRMKGLVIANGNCLENIGNISHILLDRTGTLTEGVFSLNHTKLLGSVDISRCLEIAASLESHSSHPIANAFTHTPTDLLTYEVSLENGHGITAVIADENAQLRYRIGSKTYCESLCDAPHPAFNTADNDYNQLIYLVSEKEWLAIFSVSDCIRAEASRTIELLGNYVAENNIRVLTGADAFTTGKICDRIGISTFAAGMLPEDKLNYLNKLQNQGHRVMMVGDGINDIPVLSAADISVAMSSASDLAKTKADILLLNNNLASLATLFEHGKRSMSIINQNLSASLLYNLAALPLAAIGLIPPWLAVIGMSSSSLLVTVNAMRAKNVRQQACSSADSYSMVNA